MIKFVKRLIGTFKNSRPFGARGFTLIELMVATSILTILTAMSVVLIARAKAQVRETAAQSTLNMMTTAYEEYRFRHHQYPLWGPDEEFKNPVDLVDALLNEGFLPSVYNNYQYISSGELFAGFASDYYMRILPYDANVEGAPDYGSYMIVLVPTNYQRRYLAAIFEPTAGKVSVRARKGDGRDDAWRLYTFKD